MIENFWKDKYPAGIAAEINPDQYPNILSVLKESCQRFATKPAFTNLGKTLTYGELYKLSGDFAAYLQQHTDLKPGDRIAVQLPNVLQYPIVVFGAMRAGLIVVNTNPLYTARELEHQFNDSVPATAGYPGEPVQRPVLPGQGPGPWFPRGQFADRPRGARRGDPGAGRLGLLQRRAEQPRALAFLIPPVAVRSRRRR